MMMVYNGKGHIVSASKRLRLVLDESGSQRGGGVGTCMILWALKLRHVDTYSGCDDGYDGVIQG